ncbi:hypothetical protein A5634_13080 [Mycobacterium asiaticum]|uniref:Uncharacterized protein n=1 Tax=Mycobacterium asiaticum TaxID=1790 RepID=A0A1A3PBK3_MYCAS|nr:hypothetical protein A5634_13080 [Mycobacterium asiaticum]
MDMRSKAISHQAVISGLDGRSGPSLPDHLHPPSTRTTAFGFDTFPTVKHPVAAGRPKGENR